MELVANLENKIFLMLYNRSKSTRTRGFQTPNNPKNIQPITHKYQPLGYAK